MINRHSILHAIAIRFHRFDNYRIIVYLPPPSTPRTSSLPLDQNLKKAVYNYPVLREALNIMSQVPSADKGGSGDAKQLPFLLMRTVMVSVATFPELKNFVATAVLPRLVQHKVRLRVL